MRTITVICALFLLSSCDWGPKSSEKVAQVDHTPSIRAGILGTADESSPIIISDGSIHIKHGKPERDHFRIKGDKNAVIKHANYQPEFLGYGCNASYDATLIPCSVDCAGSPVAPCRVNIGRKTIKSWTLALCQNTNSCTGNGTVKVEWNTDAGTPDFEKLEITSNGNAFQVIPKTGNQGADLRHPGNANDHLKSAALVLTPLNGNDKTYNFSCASSDPTYPMCLTIGYDCHMSGNGSCK